MYPQFRIFHANQHTILASQVILDAFLLPLFFLYPEPECGRHDEWWTTYAQSQALSDFPIQPANLFVPVPLFDCLNWLWLHQESAPSDPTPPPWQRRLTDVHP